MFKLRHLLYAARVVVLLAIVAAMVKVGPTLASHAAAHRITYVTTTAAH